jgi:hypothetical protein
MQVVRSMERRIMTNQLIRYVTIGILLVVSQSPLSEPPPASSHMVGTPSTSDRLTCVD